ncbi:MAG: hypothetical protein LBT20_01400 [Clostridiales bacterium]|jgi:hypothetical protein|nr:hypothetical protein [Clostridiales bacterium]
MTNYCSVGFCFDKNKKNDIIQTLLSYFCAEEIEAQACFDCEKGDWREVRSEKIDISEFEMLDINFCTKKYGEALTVRVEKQNADNEYAVLLSFEEEPLLKVTGGLKNCYERFSEAVKHVIKNEPLICAFCDNNADFDRGTEEILQAPFKRYSIVWHGVKENQIEVFLSPWEIDGFTKRQKESEVFTIGD